MKIYDISQEVFGCAVYPGDPAPQSEELSSIAKGNLYNLTAFSMCAHNGTHIDAPAHFLENGKTVDELSLAAFVGMAYVAEAKGDIGGREARAILSAAETADRESARRILIKGEATVTEEAARIFAAAGVLLVGCESQSVGPMNAPMAVHKILLSRETVLLEGIRLRDVPVGAYFLSAAPLNLGGAEGAPCRAVLIDF